MRTLISGGTLFDSDAGAFVPNPGVLLVGDEVAAVGGEHPDADRVVDASGKTLLPGFANLHGHLAWDGFSDLEAQCRFDGPMGYLKAARGLIAAVQAGVTTFRDLACVHDTGLYARRAVEDGLLPGPRVIPCGRAVCRTGGHIWFGNREADGVDAVMAATREQIKAGARWIKLMADGYSATEIEAVIDTAHELGVPVTTDAGIRDQRAVERAVDAGVDCIEHGGDYSDALLEKIVAKGIWIVPTLSPVIRQAREGEAWGMKPSVIERRRRQLADGGRWRGLVRARAAGAKLAFGTDSGSPVVPHDALRAEIDALLELGVFSRAEEAFQAMTIRAAELLGEGEQGGSLAPGKRADAVLVDGDVAADYAAIERVEAVWVAGRLTVEGGRAILPDPRDFRTFSNVGA